MSYTLSTSAYSPRYPSQSKIVKTSEGTLVAFYRDTSNNLKRKISTDNGVSWGSEIAVASLANDADVIIDSSNNIYIAYTYDQSYDSIYFVKLTYTALDTWTTETPVTVRTNSPYAAYQKPTITFRSNGDLWIAHTGSTSTAIFPSYSEDDGATWSYGPISGFGTIPNVVSAVSVGSEIWVFAQVSNTLGYFKTSGGNTFGSFITLDTSLSSSAYGTSVVKISDTDIWVTGRTSSGIKAFHYTGTWDSGTLITGSTDDTSASLAVVGGNTVLVYSKLGEDIYYRYYNGTSWQTEVALESSGDTCVYNSVLKNDSTYLYSVYLNGTDLIFDSIALAGLPTLIDIDTDIRAKYLEGLKDIHTDIRVVSGLLKDINTDIRAHFPTNLLDINTDIRTRRETTYDINTDIRARYNLGIYDINTDIRAILIPDSINDINTDIRAKFATDFFKDINTDIRLVSRNIKDINTDIRVVRFINNTFVEVTNLYIAEAPYTSSFTANLVIEASGAIYMQFRNENEVTFSPFEAYAENKEITLSAGDGQKTIYIKFKDINGNITDEYSTNIVVQLADPEAIIIEAYTDDSLAVPIIDSTYQNNNNPFFRWSIPITNMPYIGFSYALDDIPLDTFNLDMGDIVSKDIIVTPIVPLPEMSLNVSEGTAYKTSIRYVFSEQTLLLNDGGALDRIDLIYADIETLTIKVKQGVEAVSPIVPELPNNSLAIATAHIPNGTTNVALVTITDIASRYINLTAYQVGNIIPGQHTLQVKAFTANGGISPIATFNLYISETNPNMGAILGYTDVSKLFRIFSGTYQTASDSIYLEWTSAPSAPGPINYYYTIDGSEPTLASLFTNSTSLILSSLPLGFTKIRIRPYDVTSENFGSIREFLFVYGNVSSDGDTLVIDSDGLVLKQSLKQIEVTNINFNFNSARICKIFQPLEFDADVPHDLDEILVVVHNGITLFTGHIKTIERTITISGEGITYSCTGPRGTLTEIYAHLVNDEGLDSALITLDDMPIGEAINLIAGIAPEVINSIESLPIGSNIFDNFQGQSIEQIISAIYNYSNFGWYMEPDGTLVSVDAEVIDSGEAKFGIYGTTVNSINPQYNVIASNLQFDVNKRYNKIIIEGGTRHIRKNLSAGCAKNSQGVIDYKTFKINSNATISKVINAYATWRRAEIAHTSSAPGGSIYNVSSGMWIERWEECSQNVIKTRTYNVNTGQVLTSPFTREFPSGSVGTNNTVVFSERAYSYWWANGASYTWHPGSSILQKKCGGCQVDCLIEDGVLYAEVSLPGTADNYGSKTLRIVNTSFQYTEDPDDPKNDYDAMVAFAEDKLRSLNDIKVNGSITLDTIDTSWTLKKTVNLINTAQTGWSTINIKVVGITYNFDENTTTLELTSEFLR